MASRLGLVGPGNHVVVVERVHDAFCLKIVAVDELGLGIEREGPVDPAAVVVGGAEGGVNARVSVGIANVKTT